MVVEESDCAAARRGMRRRVDIVGNFISRCFVLCVPSIVGSATRWSIYLIDEMRSEIRSIDVWKR